MAKKIVTKDDIKGAMCMLISTREGKYKVIAKAAPYGEKGRVFASVVDEKGNPVTVTNPVEAKSLGCADVRIPRRNVGKDKIGVAELRALGMEGLAKYAIERKAPSTKQKKHVIGFLPKRLVAKIASGYIRKG